MTRVLDNEYLATYYGDPSEGDKSPLNKALSIKINCTIGNGEPENFGTIQVADNMDELSTKTVPPTQILKNRDDNIRLVNLPYDTDDWQAVVHTFLSLMSELLLLNNIDKDHMEDILDVYDFSTASVITWSEK